MPPERKAIAFARRLIKGKIAELLFELMFREMGTAEVIPFGYENTAPQLAQYQHLIQEDANLAPLRNTPDYLLISEDKTHVMLVDVKYRRNVAPSEVAKIASGIAARWASAWLFLATLEGFYMSSCSAIVQQRGSIDPLPMRWVSTEVQREYHGVLTAFLSRG